MHSEFLTLSNKSAVQSLAIKVNLNSVTKFKFSEEKENDLFGNISNDEI